MKRLLALFAVISSSALLQAQQINNVVLTPPNPTECNLIDFLIQGTMPTSGEPAGASPSVAGNVITLSFSATGGNNGSANFSQPVVGMGPFQPGTYVLNVPFTYNGNLVDTWTGGFTVGPGVNPNAGEYADTSICTSGANFPLLAILDGSPSTGGVWYNPANQVVNNGQCDPGQSLEGFYTYVFDVEPPCLDASQQIRLTYIQPFNDTGINGTVQVCSAGGPAVDLFAELGGTPYVGGTWTAPGGAAHSNMSVPITDPCGVYTYTVPRAPCGDATSTVTVQCVNPPNAGNGGSITLCDNDSVQNLNTTLTGEPNTGTWLDPFGFPLGGFNANINISLNGPGLYGYVVSSVVCPSDTAFVNVTTVPCIPGMDEMDGNVARFELSPNPTDDQVVLEVELGHATTGHVLELVDVNGAIVRSEPLIFNGMLARRVISVADLAKGAYLVRITSPDGQAVRRLMVR